MMLGTDIMRVCGAPTSSAPASRSFLPARSGLGHTCSADTGDTGNLLNREMCLPEPQQAGIAFGAWQGLKQRRIYARQDFARNGKGLLIGDPTTWKNLHRPDAPGNFLEMLAIATGASDNIEHRGRITNVKGIVAQLICLEA